MASGCPVIAWEGSERAVRGGSSPLHQSQSSVESGAIEEVGGEAILWAPMKKGALGSALEHLQDTKSVLVEDMLIAVACVAFFGAWCLVIEVLQCLALLTHQWLIAGVNRVRSEFVRLGFQRVSKFSDWRTAAKEWVDIINRTTRM